MSDKAILTIGDQQIELPVLEGTEGERAIDITKLRDQTGLITYDPSLGNTGVCRSAITFIDGEKGILRYRGIPIEQFTAKPNFVEVAWMLIFGRLPKREELARFSDLLTANELLHEGVKHPERKLRSTSECRAAVWEISTFTSSCRTVGTQRNVMDVRITS